MATCNAVDFVETNVKYKTAISTSTILTFFSVAIVYIFICYLFKNSFFESHSFLGRVFFFLSRVSFESRFFLSHGSLLSHVSFLFCVAFLFESRSIVLAVTQLVTCMACTTCILHSLHGSACLCACWVNSILIRELLYRPTNLSRDCLSRIHLLFHITVTTL